MIDEIDEFVLNNDSFRVILSSYAATVKEFWVKTPTGEMIDVVLGFDSVAGYQSQRSAVGAICGRYANRIARGHLPLPQSGAFQLPINNGPNHLHGGPDGFQYRTWRGSYVSPADPALPPTQARFQLHSPHLDMGYPGALDVTVTFTLLPRGLEISYSAVSDRETVVNLTHHGYFNLSGQYPDSLSTSPAGSSFDPVLADHDLLIFADAITRLDANQIPTGEMMPVAGSPFDFRTPRCIAERIGEDHPQLNLGQGYDHNFVLRRGPSAEETLAHAATLSSRTSGLAMECWTTEPGLQVYTSNFLPQLQGKRGCVYGRRHGICLESQHFPDSPNHTDFPSTLLYPHQTYVSKTQYLFS